MIVYKSTALPTELHRQFKLRSEQQNENYNQKAKKCKQAESFVQN